MSHQDLQAERALLGCVLAGETPRAVDVRAEDFSEEGHRAIWEACLTLAAVGKVIDPLTVADVLKTRGMLMQAGGPAALMEMAEGTYFSGIKNYAGVVVDRARRRRLHAELVRAANATYDLNLAPDRVAGEAVQRLLSTGQAASEEASDADIHELIDSWDTWKERNRRGELGVDGGLYLKTGLQKLDDYFPGWPLSLGVVGGKASMGKTALVAEMIWNWLTASLNGGIVGLEDGTAWLTRRHLARFLRIPVAQVGACELDPQREAAGYDWMAQTSAMYRKHLRIHRAGGLDAPGLVALVQRWLGEGLRWVVIDHGLRVKYDAPGERRMDLAIGRTMDTLANLAIRHKASVIVNWHINRDNEDETAPRMRDYKESGYLDAAARAMLGLWEQSSRPGYLLVTGVKSTEGKRDWTVAVPRDPECALVKSTGGHYVDFRAEREAQRTERGAARGAQLFDLTKR